LGSPYGGYNGVIVTTPALKVYDRGIKL